MIATQLERSRFGKSRRETVSRAAQADLRAKERRFAPLDILRAAEEGRVRQLLPIKYARMKVSPFAFFRGAVSIMAADLGRLPHSGLTVQLCGDAHVQNLGSFAAPEGADRSGLCGLYGRHQEGANRGRRRRIGSPALIGPERLLAELEGFPLAISMAADYREM